MKSQAFAQGLREWADWIDDNPTIELPDSVFSVYALNTKKEAAECLAALKPCKKEYRDAMFYLSRDFAGITLKFCFYRDAVCTKKVVGKKIVAAQIIPARISPEEVIPAHEEDIVEWECGSPLLAEQAPEDIKDEEDIPF